ncbi:MAG: hypothetical protein ACYC6Y_08575 [Thermoguttaceae bacterium]
MPKKPKDINEHRLIDATATVRLVIPPGKYAVAWVNPKNGLADDIQTVEHQGQVLTLKSPVFSDDIALRILAAE